MPAYYDIRMSLGNALAVCGKWLISGKKPDFNSQSWAIPKSLWVENSFFDVLWTCFY